ncbi:hypothetical protein NM688_g3458 [Phlebia brevispora]|uniref:Uncharacterized protein n=1 Tax=Phlebia brevispora TaxID=194682 RepID=A0ACC1T5R0_9APHY|nr:hypothetical protein NM688_g3458 [Phlebia brevispora]
MTSVTVSDKVHRHALVKLAGKVNLPEYANLPYPDQIREAMTWDFMSLTGLALLSDAGREVASTVLAARLHRLWEPHFTHPLRFHDLMVHTHAVLIGSTAIQFLQPSADWVPNNFDFCTPDDNYDAFCNHLVSEERATVLVQNHFAQPHEASTVYASSGIKQLTTVRLPSGMNINIYRSPTISALHCIPSSIGTHLVNYIGAHTLSVAYPFSLDAREAYYEDHMPSTDIQAAKQKYERRGFLIREPPTPCEYGCLRDGYCARALRFFGDEHCITIRFVPRGRCELLRAVPPSPFGRFNLFSWTTAWTRGGRPCGNEWCKENVPYSRSLTPHANSDDLDRKLDHMLWAVYRAAQHCLRSTSDFNPAPNFGLETQHSDSILRFINTTLEFLAISERHLPFPALSRELLPPSVHTVCHVFHSLQCELHTTHHDIATLLLHFALPDAAQRNSVTMFCAASRALTIKCNWLRHWHSECHTIPEVLLATAAALQLFFASLFAGLYWSSRLCADDTLLTATKLIHADHIRHCDYVLTLYRGACIPLSNTLTRAIIHAAAEIEKTFISDLLATQFLGLNHTLLREYVEHVADNLLAELTVSPLYFTRNPLMFVDNSFNLRVASEYCSAASLPARANVVLDGEFSTSVDF